MRNHRVMGIGWAVAVCLTLFAAFPPAAATGAEKLTYRLKWLFNTSVVGDLYADVRGDFAAAGHVHTCEEPPCRPPDRLLLPLPWAGRSRRPRRDLYGQKVLPDAQPHHGAHLGRDGDRRGPGLRAGKGRRRADARADAAPWRLSWTAVLPSPSSSIHLVVS